MIDPNDGPQRTRIPVVTPYPTSGGPFLNPFSDSTLQKLSFDAVKTWSASLREESRASGELDQDRAFMAPIVDACYSAFRVLAQRILITCPVDSEDFLDVGLNLAARHVISFAFYLTFEVRTLPVPFDDKYRLERAVDTWSKWAKGYWQEAVLDEDTDASEEWWAFSGRRQARGFDALMAHDPQVQMKYPVLLLEWHQRWGVPEFVEEVVIEPPVRGNSEDEITKRRRAALEWSQHTLTSQSQREKDWERARLQERGAEAGAHSNSEPSVAMLDELEPASDRTAPNANGALPAEMKAGDGGLSVAPNATPPDCLRHRRYVAVYKEMLAKGMKLDSFLSANQSHFGRSTFLYYISGKIQGLVSDERRDIMESALYDAAVKELGKVQADTLKSL